MMRLAFAGKIGAKGKAAAVTFDKSQIQFCQKAGYKVTKS